MDEREEEVHRNGEIKDAENEGKEAEKKRKTARNEQTKDER